MAPELHVHKAWFSVAIREIPSSGEHFSLAVVYYWLPLTFTSISDSSACANSSQDTETRILRIRPHLFKHLTRFGDETVKFEAQSK